MNRTIKPAPVRKSVTVPVPQAHAFEFFTADFDRWWPRGHSIGKGPLREVVLEPRAGGRWYGIDEDGSETDWGDVLTWQPPTRVVIAWRIGADWQYHAELTTEVEVNFTALSGNATRVDLEHRLLENFGPGAQTMRDSIDSPGGWGGILQGFAELCRSG
jgi:uncharacterized protein YndB with AHSA1/START domain